MDPSADVSELAGWMTDWLARPSLPLAADDTAAYALWKERQKCGILSYLSVYIPATNIVKKGGWFVARSTFREK